MTEQNSPQSPNNPDSLKQEPGSLVVAPGMPAADSPADATAVNPGRAGKQLLTGNAARNMPPSLSPAQITWRELRKNNFAVGGGIILILMYTIALFAPFLAPYDPQNQLPGGPESASFHPPMRLRFREANGGSFHLRPFVYGTVQQFTPLHELVYPLDAAQQCPVEFFVRGDSYRFFGIFPSTIHLFGVAPGQRVFLLGTDDYGRDYLTRLLYGSQISLSVGLIAIFITFTLGMLVGGISGFYGGIIDEVIMRVCEIIMSVPDFYLLLALAAALPATWPPVRVYILIIVILSFIGWAGMARIVRGMVLSVREREYVEAARALGVSDLKIIVRHILPSTFTFAIVAATLSVPGYILGEAGLSFLGLGIRDPMASWGNMLSAAQDLNALQTHHWILAPGFAIAVTTLAFNFLGDGLRDALDPKSRRLG